MERLTNSTKEYSLRLSESYDIPIIIEFFDAINCVPVFLKNIKSNRFVFFDKSDKEKNKRLASFVRHEASSIQAVYLMQKSSKSTRQPLRHYTIDICKAFAEKNNFINNQTVIIFIPSTYNFYHCTIHINHEINDEKEIRLPLIFNQFDDKTIVLLNIKRILCCPKKQLASKIKDNKISISKALYQEMIQDTPSFLMVRHLFTGATIMCDFSCVEGTSDLKDDQIRLNYCQRKNLNLVDRQALANEKDNTILIDKVKRTNEITEIFESFFDSNEYSIVQLVPIYLRTKQKKNSTVLDFLVGDCQMNLSAIRPYEIDDSRDIVRLSEDSMTLLGIEESDKVLLKYKNQRCEARAMKIDSFEFMQQTNILFCERDLDLIVGVPAPIRRKLGIEDVETEVIVERDTKYLFFKNLNIQLISVLGLLLAVFQIGDNHYKVKTVMCFALLPFIIWASLSQERSKVKKYKKNKKT